MRERGGSPGKLPDWVTPPPPQRLHSLLPPPSASLPPPSLLPPPPGGQRVIGIYYLEQRQTESVAVGVVVSWRGRGRGREGRGHGVVAAALEAEQVGLKVFFTFWVPRFERFTDAIVLGAKLRKQVEDPRSGP